MRTVASLFTIICFLFFFGCQKDTSEIVNESLQEIEFKPSDILYRDYSNEFEKSFFHYNNSNGVIPRNSIDEFVAFVNEFIYTRENSSEFASHLYYDLGIPKWSETLIHVHNEFVVIPILNEEEITGILTVVYFDGYLLLKVWSANFISTGMTIENMENLNLYNHFLNYFSNKLGVSYRNDECVEPCDFEHIKTPTGQTRAACYCGVHPCPPGYCYGSVGGGTNDDETPASGKTIYWSSYYFDQLQKQWTTDLWGKLKGEDYDNSSGGNVNNNGEIVPLNLDILDDLLEDLDQQEDLECLITNVPIAAMNQLFFLINNLTILEILAEEMSCPEGEEDAAQAETIQQLLGFLAANPGLSLTGEQINYLINNDQYSNSLLDALDNNLASHPNDSNAILASNDLIALHMSGLQFNFDDEFVAIYNFYVFTSDSNKEWLNLPANKIFKDQIISNLMSFANNDILAKEIIDDHLTSLRTNEDYKNFVTSTFGWGGAMWSIAKELIGDKIVDIIISFIPGFGNADEIRDAVKAAKNGDYLEFTIEVGKIVVNNSPLSKLFKAWDAVDTLYDYYQKIERIWDKISGFTETVIEQMWVIVKKYGDNIVDNSDIMYSIAKAIKRGLKSIDEVMNAIPTFNQMTPNRMKHILHGDTGGGLHHASGLVNDPTKEVIDLVSPNDKGVYKIKYKYKDASGNEKEKWSTMFPDDKSEIQVAKSIEFVYGNNISNPYTNPALDPSRRFISGIDSNNLEIEIEIDINDNVLTAYPIFN